jgi:hypothetical protein
LRSIAQLHIDDRMLPLPRLDGMARRSEDRVGPDLPALRKGNRVGDTRLTGKTVCVIMKDYAQLVGLSRKDYGANSLRSGFLTSAARRGASVFKMRDVNRHKSMDVLQSYVRDADLFRDHAGLACYDCCFEAR